MMIHRQQLFFVGPKMVGCFDVMPIGSMYGIFTYIYVIFRDGKCREMYHTWSVWDGISTLKSGTCQEFLAGN